MSDSENVKSVNVGDLVDWDKVEDGWLVKDAEGWHALRMRGRGIWVGEPGENWLSANPWDDGGRWRWTCGSDCKVTVIATDLTDKESAADLQRLAEVFEVREALQASPDLMSMQFNPGLKGDLHEHLHDAGWRPGMTTKDAVLMLAIAEVRKAIVAMWGDDPPVKNGYPDFIAGLLHSLGWQPGMTEKDAARLLAEADNTRTE